MNQLRDHFLASATFAQDQDIHIDIGKEIHLTMNFKHLWRRRQEEIAAIEIFYVGNCGHVAGNMIETRGIARKNRTAFAVGMRGVVHAVLAIPRSHQFDDRLDVFARDRHGEEVPDPEFSGFSRHTLLTQLRDQADFVC